MTLKELSQTYSNAKHPNVPEHCRPNKKFSEGSANELTKSILAYFELKGIKAWRQASEGRYLPEKRVKNIMGQSIVVGGGKFIPRSKAAKGIGDICAVYNSKFITLEIKFGKDRQSEVQKEFENEITKAGGIYLIIRTWDGFIGQINQIVK